MVLIQGVVLTLDEFSSFGVLESLEEQNEDVFPVLSDGLSVEVKPACGSRLFTPSF